MSFVRSPAERAFLDLADAASAALSFVHEERRDLSRAIEALRAQGNDGLANSLEMEIEELREQLRAALVANKFRPAQEG